MATSNPSTTKDLSSKISNMLQSFTKSFITQKYTDIEIICEDRTFPAHRMIICGRSKVLERMCRRGEGAFKEGTTGTIKLLNDDPNIIEKMLSFLYRLDYDDGSPDEIWEDERTGLRVSFKPTTSVKALVSKTEQAASSSSNIVEQKPDTEKKLPENGSTSVTVDGSSDLNSATATNDNEAESPNELERFSSLALNAQMYTMGERYDIPELKKLAQQKFEERVKDKGWNDEGFSIAVREVYEETAAGVDDGLKKVLIRVASTNIKALRDRGEFKEVLDGIPDFTRDLFDEVLDSSPAKKTY